MSSGCASSHLEKSWAVWRPRIPAFSTSHAGRRGGHLAGAEADVAMSVAHLGGREIVVTLPGACGGGCCVANLRAVVDTRHILRTPQGGSVFISLRPGSSQRPGNVIYDREGSSVSLTPPKDYPWDEIFEGAGWFHISGSRLPFPRMRRRSHFMPCAGHATRQGMFDELPLQALDLEAGPETARTGHAGRDLDCCPMSACSLADAKITAAMMGIILSRQRRSVLDVSRQIKALYPQVTHVAMTLRKSLSANHHNWGSMLYDAALDEVFLAPLNGDRYQPYAITDIVDRLGGGRCLCRGLDLCPELAGSGATPDCAELCRGGLLPGALQPRRL